MNSVAVEPPRGARLPKKMLRAYKHSTNEHRALFNQTYEGLTDIGLSLYPTDCPDLRAKHPLNDLVFVILGFQEVAGTKLEIRVDSIPSTVWAIGPGQPVRVVQHWKRSRARWAVYWLPNSSSLAAVQQIVHAIALRSPNWGNTVGSDNWAAQSYPVESN